MPFQAVSGVMFAVGVKPCIFGGSTVKRVLNPLNVKSPVHRQSRMTATAA